MAEILGAVSAVATLLEVSLKLSKSTWTLYCSVQDAPEILGTICTKISLIHLKLQHVQTFNQRLTNNVKGDCIQDLQRALKVALFQCEEALDSIQKCIAIQARMANLQAKVRWALLGKEKTATAFGRVQQAEASLTDVLDLFNLHFSFTTFEMVQEMHERHLHPLLGPHPLQVGQVQPEPAQPTFTYRKAIPSNRSNMLSTVSRYTLPGRDLGFTGLISSSRNENFTTTSLLLSSRLPPPFHDHKFVLELILRHFPMQWSAFTLLRGSLALKSRVRDDSDIMIACRSGREDIVRSHFHQGRASPNDISDTSETPLTNAIISGNGSLVRYLIDMGSDVNCIDNHRQRSPLQLAIQEKQFDIFRLLLFRGADPDHVNAHGKQIVHYAFENNTSVLYFQECWDLLLSCGFQDFGAQDAYGRSALHWAAWQGTGQEVSSLIDRHASLDPVWMPMGQTPLHIAVRMDNANATRELICRGASIQAQSMAGWTPLHYALYNGNMAIVKALMAAGADSTCSTVASNLYSVPAEFRGRSVTTKELASLHGTLFEDEYLDLFGSDIFYDAEE